MCEYILSKAPIPVPRNRASVATLQPLHLFWFALCVKCCIIVFFISCLLNSALWGIKNSNEYGLFQMFSFGTQYRMKIFGAICSCNNKGWKMPSPLFQSYLFRASVRQSWSSLCLWAHTGLWSSWSLQLGLSGGEVKPLLRVGNFSTRITQYLSDLLEANKSQASS